MNVRNPLDADGHIYEMTILGEWISGPVCMYIARCFANPDSASKEV